MRVHRKQTQQAVYPDTAKGLLKWSRLWCREPGAYSLHVSGSHFGLGNRTMTYAVPAITALATGPCPYSKMRNGILPGGHMARESWPHGQMCDGFFPGGQTSGESWPHGQMCDGFFPGGQMSGESWPHGQMCDRVCPGGQTSRESCRYSKMCDGFFAGGHMARESCRYSKMRDGFFPGRDMPRESCPRDPSQIRTSAFAKRRICTRGALRKGNLP
jgi:hypothetical protein